MKIAFTAVALLASIASARKEVFKQDMPGIPDHVLQKFKEKSGLREDWSPNGGFKRIPKGQKHFEIGGVDIQIDDLEPIDDLFAEDAEVIVDDVKKTTLKVHVFRSKSNPDVRVVLDDSKDIIKASKGQVDLVPIGFANNFAEIDAPIDVDYSKLDVEMSDGAEPESRRQLRGNTQSDRRLATLSPPSPNCATIAEATVYIGADSDFAADAIAECDTCNVPNDEKAVAAIQEIFAAVKDVYLDQLCINLKLSGIDVKTSASNDWYRNVRLSSNVNQCGGYGSFLYNFAYWLSRWGYDPSYGKRTVFHLFYGGQTTTPIGCSYIGTAGDWRWGVGVSQASFMGVYSSSMINKRNLIAHEIGHNFKASHDSGIMTGYNGAYESFTDYSVNQIQGCVNGGCYALSLYVH